MSCRDVLFDNLATINTTFVFFFQLTHLHSILKTNCDVKFNNKNNAFWYYDSKTYSIGFETGSCGLQTVMWLDGCGFI